MLVVAWSPDAKYVASADHSGLIVLWDPKTGKATGQCAVRGARGGFRLRMPSKATLSLMYVLLKTCTLMIPGPNNSCQQGHRKFVSSLSWEPAHVELPSRRFCSGSKDNTIKIWEASSRWDLRVGR